MAVRLFTELFNKDARHFIWMAFVAALMAMGYAHMANLGFGRSMFMDSLREHLLLCAAGFMAGWVLRDAVSGYIRELFLSPSRSLVIWPAAGYVLLPLLLMVVLHQFRYFLNDGPANISMGLGLFISGIISSRVGKGLEVGKVPGLAEVKMEDEKLLALLRTAYSDSCSAPVLVVIADAHKRLGNSFKAELAQALSESCEK